MNSLRKLLYNLCFSKFNQYNKVKYNFWREPFAIMCLINQFSCSKGMKYNSTITVPSVLMLYFCMMYNHNLVHRLHFSMSRAVKFNKTATKNYKIFSVSYPNTPWYLSISPTSSPLPDPTYLPQIFPSLINKNVGTSITPISFKNSMQLSFSSPFILAKTTKSAIDLDNLTTVGYTCYNIAH